MNDYECHIQDALDIVEAWEIDNEPAFFQAVNDQARLMAGREFMDGYEYHHSAEPYISHR